MLPEPYNSNYRIVQAPGYVAILVELNHMVRIIPLDGRAHVPPNVPQWTEAQPLIVLSCGDEDRNSSGKRLIASD
jgi:hypothetical protein